LAFDDLYFDIFAAGYTSLDGVLGKLLPSARFPEDETRLNALAHKK
jgi:hypothetical protein